MTPPKSARFQFAAHRMRQGMWVLPYKTLRCRGRADRAVRLYKSLCRAAPMCAAAR